MEQITLTRLDDLAEAKISGERDVLVAMVYSAIKDHEIIRDVIMTAANAYIIDILEEQERIRLN